MAAHQWAACIRVHYGRSYWQVGNTVEQNGSYKMAMNKAKRELVHQKTRACIANARVKKHEIMLVLTKAWEQSFA